MPLSGQMKHEWPSIKERGEWWVVDTGNRFGAHLRQRKRAKTKKEAEKIADDLREEFQHGGTAASLTPVERSQALQAFELLKGKPDTLVEAVQFFIKRRYPKGSNRSIGDLADEFITEKKATNVVEAGERRQRYSDAYLISLHKIQQLGDEFRDVLASDITHDAIEKYFDSKALNQSSRYHYYQYYRMFFNWAVKKHYMVENPVAQIQIPHVPHKDPEILSPSQAKHLVHLSSLHRPEIFPYIVLGLFCGVRPRELSRLRWGDFRDDGKVLRVSSQVAKTGDVRSIQVPFNCWLMLKPVRERKKAEELVAPFTHNKIREYFHAAYWRAGIRKWPKDACRHSFASYYLAATSNMTALMSRLGHTSSKTTMRHYVNLTDNSWYDYFTITNSEDQWQEMEKALEQYPSNQINNREDLSPVLQALWLL